MSVKKCCPRKCAVSGQYVIRTSFSPPLEFAYISTQHSIADTFTHPVKASWYNHKHEATNVLSIMLLIGIYIKRKCYGNRAANVL